MSDPNETPPARDIASPASAAGAAPSPGERGTGRPATDDPYVEGGEATTDEWFGQSVERDTELAERLVDEHGGDLNAAERDFDAQATGAEEQEARRHGPPPSESDETRG